MEQINNKVLVNTINQMKNLPEFKKFVRNCKKRVSNFEKGKKFNYSNKKKKVTQVYDFSSDKSISEYVSLLNNNIDKIITCDALELNNWKREFDKINLKKVDSDVLKGFFNEIQKRLKYKELRSGNDKLLFKFYQRLKIKACVYCNSQHVVLLKSSEIARLQADHNLSKFEYPCFAITLANLYPSCNNCNHLKKEDDIQYNLYFFDNPKREFFFKLNELDIANFYLNRLNENDLKIDFDQGRTRLEDVLKISEIYENHIDYVVDILCKHKVYSKTYVSQLITSFNTLLGNNEDVINRIIFGSTLKNEDINQRVFSKLTIDIKNQLDNLKNASN